MRAWDVWLLVTCIHMSGCVLATKVPEFCEQARNHCLSRIGCQMAFNNFLEGCNDVIIGRISTCPTKCKNALISLLSTENSAGIAFVNCNCSSDQYCQIRKRRVEICARDVMLFRNNMDEHAVVSCGLARWVCEADTSCLAALQYYIQHCAKLVNGQVCSRKCNNSLDILYRQDSSKMLQTCACDGTEDYDCQALKDNTERLCFNRQPTGAPYTYSGTERTVGGGSSSSRISSGRAARRAGTRPRSRKDKRKAKGVRSRKSKKRRDRHLKRKRRRERRRKKRKGKGKRNSKSRRRKLLLGDAHFF